MIRGHNQPLCLAQHMLLKRLVVGPNQKELGRTIGQMAILEMAKMSRNLLMLPRRLSLTNLYQNHEL